LNTASKKVRAPDLALIKGRGERIVMLTADDVRQGAFPQPAVTRRDRVPVLLAL